MNVLKVRVFGASLCIFCVLCSGCNMMAKKGRPLSELTGSENNEQYIVSAGDTLQVRVWGEPRLSGEVFVREDGRFTLPLINDVDAAGQSLQLIADDITKKLAEFVPAASVSISVIQTAPTTYFLSGAFNSPGRYSSPGKITLLQAIATGGGFAPFADESSVVLIRKTPGGEIRYQLDYNRVIDGREPNPALKSGDILAVK